MANPWIKLGEKMKNWLREIIDGDFGKNVSIPMGLYHIVKCYEKYTPEWKKRELRSKLKGRQRLIRS